MKTKTKKVGLMTEDEINQAIVDELGRWLAFEEPMERIRDLIAAEGELGDVKAERDRLQAELEAIKNASGQFEPHHNFKTVIDGIHHMRHKIGEFTHQITSLQSELAKCREALKDSQNLTAFLKLTGTQCDDGELCFCDYARRRGNPLFKVHSPECLTVRTELKRHEDQSKAALEGGK